jgi:hypothetical protein
MLAYCLFCPGLGLFLGLFPGIFLCFQQLLGFVPEKKGLPYWISRVEPLASSGLSGAFHKYGNDGSGVRGSQHKIPEPNSPLRIPNPESRKSAKYLTVIMNTRT